MLKLGSPEHPVYIAEDKIVAVQPADEHATLVHVAGGVVIVPQAFAAVVQALGYESAPEA